MRRILNPVLRALKMSDEKPKPWSKAPPKAEDTYALLEQYPRLVLNAWTNGYGDFEARIIAHDFVKQYLASNPLPPYDNSGEIPRKIWMYWDQGWENAPPIVAACRRRMEKMATDYELNFIDYQQILSLVQIPPLIRQRLQDNRTTYSEVVRYSLLESYGGIWIDATCYLAQPLDGLLERNHNRYFSYTRWDKLLSNWMMMAPKGHLITTWLSNVKQAWWLSRSDFPAYFLSQYLFQALCSYQPLFEQEWENRLFIAGKPTLLNIAMPTQFNEKVFHHILNETYVQKLSYKYDYAKNPPKGSFAWHIINN